MQDDNDIVPKYFPGEEVMLILTKSKAIVTKIGISYGGKIDYLCWDGAESYMWLDEFQIYSEVPRVIGFNIKSCK